MWGAGGEAAVCNYSTLSYLLKASQKGEMISKTSSDPRAHKHLRRCLQDQFWFQSMEVYGTHLTGKVLLKKGTEF